MALTQITALNQTGSPINLTRLGLTVPGSGQLVLTDYAYVHEIKSDESLHTELVAGNIRLNVGDHVLTIPQSINWFINVSSEVKYPVDALADSNVASLSGTTTIDGVSLVAGNRVLLTAQTTASQNGIFVIQAGAWTRPNDFPVGGSAAGAIVQVDRGTTYGDQLWTCDSNEGSAEIDTDNLSWSASSGGATTLQEAYDAGNTITTDAGGGNLIFAGTETVQVTATGGLDLDTIFDFDGSTFDVQMTGSNGFSLDGTASSNVTADSGNLTLSTTTSGTLIMSSVAGATLDSTTLSIDSTDTTNISMTANNAGGKTFTIGATNAGAGAGNLDINVDDAFTLDAASITQTSTGIFDVDASGAIQINSSGASIGIGNDAVDQNINIGTAGNRTISIGAAAGTTTLDLNAGSGGASIDSLGVIDLDADGALSLNASGANAINVGNDANTGDINIGTGASARTMIIGNQTSGTSVEIDAADGIRLDGDTTVVGNLDVLGTTTSVDSTIVNVADNYMYLNKDYTTVSALPGGLVVNYLPTATNDTVASGGFTAGGGGDATVATTGAATFSTSDIIQISNANNPQNDGVYEVLSHAANVLTIRGPSTATVEPFTQDDFVTDTTVQGAIRKVSVSVIRVGTDGVWETGNGATTGISYTDLATASGTTLNQAYENGSTITTNGTDGDVVIAGTEALNITATNGLNLDTIFDFDGTSFDVQMTGGNGFSIDGQNSSNVSLVANTAGTATMTFSATNIGAGDGAIDMDTDGAFTLDAGTASIDATGASNLTVTGADLTLSTATSGDVIISGADSALMQGLRYYGASATAPSTPTPADGDRYYDTALDMEMRYDGTRSKWLSVEAMYLQFGRNGPTNAGQYYRAIDGRVMSSTTGYTMPHSGTVVALGYTRTDSDATDFEVVQDGTLVVAVASAATSGTSTALNSDFTAADVLAVRNESAGNVTDDVVGWVKVRWRA